MTSTSLVTGASGFIGGHLARRLLAAGHRVRCLVRQTSQVGGLERLGVDLVFGDVTDPGSLAGAVADCRYVLHCAAMVSDWGTVEEIRRVNVTGTRNLLAAAADASVERFIHLSTTDVYGYPEGRAIDEAHPPGRFRNWYAQTKLEAEQEVGGATGFEAVILRPATVYGPGSGAVVGEMAKALRGRHMILVGRGGAVAGLTYVENLADAAVLALGEPAAPGQAFNVTDGLPITWREFLDDLADGLGFPRVRWSLPYGVANAVASGLEHGYRALRRTSGLRTAPLLSRQAVHVLGRAQDFSNQKARKRLGWTPRVGYDEGLAATLDWLRQEYLAS